MSNSFKKINTVLKSVDNNVNRKSKETQKKLLKAYKTALIKVRNEITSLELRYGDTASYAQMHNQNRLQNIERTIVKELTALGNKEAKTIYNDVKDIYTETYKTTASGYNQIMKESIGFGVFDKETIVEAVNLPLDKIKWETSVRNSISTLEITIREEISSGLIQGKSFKAISKNITDRFNVAANKSLTITRTETHRAVNTAKEKASNDFNESAKRLGYKTVKKWLSAKDGRTRETHNHLNHKEADENGYWYIDGIPTKGPGLSGIAKEDINCRCTIIYEILPIN